jgi:aspartyl-tRNA(Asn)/glutamyl-tRNA(Gln) amidotransferase subunit A
VRYASVAEIASALRKRSLSVAELVEETERDLVAVAPLYNALATALPGRAREEAARADRRLAAGDAPMLCGVPYGAKDLFAARGGPTTWGAPAFAGQIFDTDATVVRRLASDGAVLVAKLAMSELAGGGRPAKPGASLHGQGRNPWDPERYSGGSSSGSGISVALGLVPYALGTETGGSVLGPAAFSGVTGLRPTYGIVPRGGVMTLSWTLDKVGPLARAAEDAAIVMDAIATRRPAGGFYAATQRRPPEPLRVAFSSAELNEAAPPIRAALGRAVEAFCRLYPSFVDVELERDGTFITALEDIVRVEGAFGIRDELRRDNFVMSDERQLATLRAGLDVPVAEYLGEVRVVTARARSAFARLFRRVDVVLSASRVAIAPRLDETRPPRDATKMSDLLRAAGNLAGVPGISIPCGLSAEGLPVGLQIVGPRGSDARLLAIGAAFQRESDYHLARPPEPAAAS